MSIFDTFFGFATVFETPFAVLATNACLMVPSSRWETQTRPIRMPFRCPNLEYMKALFRLPDLSSPLIAGICRNFLILRPNGAFDFTY